MLSPRTDSKTFWSELLGWYGVAAILGAYALLSFDFLSADEFLYQGLNATGAIGVAVDAWFQRNYQPLVLNLVWFVIACLAIANLVSL